MSKYKQREEIIDRISRSSGIDRDIISEVITEMYNSMHKAIRSGIGVSVIGFGKFVKSKYKEELLTCKKEENES